MDIVYKKLTEDVLDVLAIDYMTGDVIEGY